ncbi:hypothetical protein ABS768_08980 [Flavobacterium sp. ST-75]|uniref:Uncharacterized protein n=1 Tax=Flavobacterium rhizophilum TaxID=3163296 RepID=A0ABW8YBN4_9FLAO
MKTYQKYLENYKRGFIGFNTLGILFQSCLGSAAAMLVLQNGTSLAQMVQLFFITFSVWGLTVAYWLSKSLK